MFDQVLIKEKGPGFDRGFSLSISILADLVELIGICMLLILFGMVGLRT
jgi:hypothetical protein